MDDPARPRSDPDATEGKSERTAELEPFSMGGVGRQALIYGFGILLQRSISFVMLPLYTRKLTDADYGILALIQMTLDVLSIVAGKVLVLGVYRFYYKAETPAERTEIVSAAMMGLATAYFLVSSSAFLAADQLSLLIFDTEAHAGLFRIAAGSLFFQSFILIPWALARLRDMARFYVIGHAIQLVLQATLNIIFLVPLEMGVEGILLSTLITSVVMGIGYTIWVIRTTGFDPDWAAFKRLARYGAPLVGMQVATFAMTFGDRYFLQVSAGEATVGIYDLAYKFGFLLLVLSAEPFNLVWSPKRFEIAKRPDRDALLARGFVYLNVAVVTVGVALVLFTPPLLRVLITPMFYPAIVYIPVIVLAYTFQGWAGTQDIGILVSERTEYLTLGNWIAAVIALVGYAVLVPRFGAWGAAIATVAALFTRWITTYRFSQKLWRVEYDWRPVLQLLAFGIATYLAAELLAPEGLIGSVAVRTFLFAAFAGTVWSSGILSERERGWIRGLPRWLLSSLRPGR